IAVEVPVRSAAPGLSDQMQHRVEPTDLGPAAERGVAERRVGEPVDTRHPDRGGGTRVPPGVRTMTGRRPPAPAERGRRYQPYDRIFIVHQRDQGGPDWHAP